MYKKTHVLLMSSFLIKNVMKSLIFSFFMLTCSLAFSQHVSLRGSVSDGKTPLPEARIVVEGQEQHTVSDFRGEFELLLPKGLYTLEVMAKGYLKTFIFAVPPMTSVRCSIALVAIRAMPLRSWLMG